MSKFSTLIKILKQICRNPNSLKNVLQYDQIELMKYYVIKKYGFEGGLPSIDMLDIFPNFKEEIKPFSFLGGGSSSLELAFLKSLARRYKNCRYLEIGTWRGESIANVSSVAEECISISLSDKELLEQGVNQNHIKNQRFFSKKLPNVKHFEHDSLTFDFKTIGKFDLIFVDGNHCYQYVKKDTENVFKVLKNENSIIVWHDYLSSLDDTIKWDTFAGILDGYPEHKINKLFHVSNTIFSIYTEEEITLKKFIHPPIPDKIFNVNITSSKIS